MRPKLKRIEGERKTFTGTFARFGKKDRYRPKKVGDEWVTHDLTVLLVDVRDSDGNPVTDHLWFNYNTELRYSTNLTIQQRTSISILLYRNKCRVVECINHVTNLVLKFRTNKQYTSTGDGLGVNHTRTSNNLGTLRTTVLIQGNRQTLQVCILDY